MAAEDTKGSGYLRSPVSDVRSLGLTEEVVQMSDSCEIGKSNEVLGRLI